MRCLLLLGGVLLALHVPASLSQALFWLLVAAVPLLAFLPRLRLGLLLVFGFLYAYEIARMVQAPAITTGERQLVQAEIRTIPALGNSGWQFDARIRFPKQPHLAAQLARLTMPRTGSPPQVGEHWQFAVQFSTGLSTDQARALLRDRVSSMARVLQGPLNLREREASWSIDRWRMKVARHIDARVVDPSAAALLAALAVGATGDVSAQQWRVFNATGITHLVAISGMHVTFFAMISMALARLAWRRLPGLPARMRREVFAAIVGVTLALAYALLSGFSVPAQRTVVMLAAFLSVRECARCTRSAWSVAAALVGVLLYDPLAALSAGFWLSFAAVAAIVMVAGAKLQPGAPLQAATQVQGLVTVALLPATLAIFGTFSAVGVLANALAIPVFTFLLVPPVLLATAGYLLPSALHFGAHQLVDFAAWIATLLWPVLTRCAELSGAVWPATPPAAWYLLVPGALLLALAPLTLAVRMAALCALGSVFLLREPRPPIGALWMDVLDVGASSVVVLRTKQHLLLYGTGEKFGSAGRTFESRVLPLVRSSGYAAVNLWLPGTLGRDVQAAVVRAAATLPLQRMELPPGAVPPPEFGICHTRQWRWDDIDFSVAPADAARGCVLRATVGGTRLELAAETGRAEVLPAEAADWAPQVLLLPRAASAAAQRVPRDDALLLASVSQSEWQSASWRRLRDEWSEQGLAVLATAAEGRIRLQISADGQLRRP